ncbi:4-(cytidine 5'-diphospho)-2-C-methyl-D-erythritol kinase [Cerasicoccus fimbriatus]|uniref:4-(cytidine 5'-diphospho)-2-C-methyl-D-erythritol kinase n=1 Tax=Cerasicoccus fimbriatus TaxID=3014554 RepID=UPI0022B3A05E|nr:4-(cytidine 5'-diphospho)-2-C-methyl-D-erythritol kinase [Cerasicoccus sp. TK19100]
MPELTIFSPAKINLVLAITGVREDGFHELVSLVAPVNFGDEITVELVPGQEGDVLTCDFPGVPTDGSNLALRAVTAFRQKHHFAEGVRIQLDKRIPAGAGLGGGSSNASAVLAALNQLTGEPLTNAELIELSATLGSDCPLFLAKKPVIMRGRGEHLSDLEPAANDALKGQRLIIFKPSFGVETGWAYGRMKANGSWYLPTEKAEDMLSQWQASPNSSKVPLFNNMQDAAFEKYLALPTVLELLRERHAVRCLMSGSGSSCFVCLEEGDDVASITATIRECLGEDVFCVETSIV